MVKNRIDLSSRLGFIILLTRLLEGTGETKQRALLLFSLNLAMTLTSYITGLEGAGISLDSSQ